MSYTILQLLLLFFVYAFLGWCAEVAFAAFDEGRFVNRGFLNGPICPIYGFGILGVILLLQPLSDNLPLLYVGSVVLTSVIEFVTGFVLEKLFHAKWWDYSDKPLNIMGYVCLPFSLFWGIGCVFIVKVVHPLLYQGIEWLPESVEIALICLFGAVLVVDMIATLAAIRKLDERLRLLAELAAEIHEISDNIGSAISDTTLIAKKKVEAGEELYNEGLRALNEKRAEATELYDRGKRIVAEKFEQGKESATERITQGKDAVAEKLSKGKEALSDRITQSKESLSVRFAEALELTSRRQGRLLDAFPHLTVRQNQESLNAVRKRRLERRKEKKNPK